MPFLMLMMQESGKTQTQKNTENMKFKLQLLNFEMCLSRWQERIGDSRDHGNTGGKKITLVVELVLKLYMP